MNGRAEEQMNGMLRIGRAGRVKFAANVRKGEFRQKSDWFATRLFVRSCVLNRDT